MPLQTTDRPVAEGPTTERTKPPSGVVDLTSPFRNRRLGEILVSRGCLQRDRLNRALRHQRTEGMARPLGQILIEEALASAEDIDTGLALQSGIWTVPVQSNRAEATLVRAFGADRCLRYRVLPWRRQGGQVIVASARPSAFHTARPALEAVFGQVRFALAEDDAIQSAIATGFSDDLTQLAEARPPAHLSVRAFSRLRLAMGLLIVLGVLATLATQILSVLIAMMTAIAALALAGMTGLKAAALLKGPGPARPFPRPGPMAERLPRISLLVPLLDEAAISAALLTRLQSLDYPQSRLDVVFVLEETDRRTPKTLHRHRIPPTWRVVTVPKGTVQTKPRALNYALDFAEGDIIGIYDAEDAPDADQLQRVAAQFATTPPEVVCLQGRLDFYNARQNLLARWFTIDYAAWFRVVLPGLSRLGFAIPLGGTTLFFRRAALEEIGRWDAHNVTEDADLGIRLARVGMRAEMVETSTHEEANCFVLPWIRQRARWLKGYALTWAVHMRNPRRLWRELGPRKFIGFQILFLGSTVLFLLAPLMWSFLLIPLGLPHPANAWPSALLTGLIALFVFSEIVNAATHIWGLKRRGDFRLMPWALTMPFYFPLAAVASYRALVGAVLSPFQWEKTPHGHSVHALRPPRPALPRSASSGFRKRG